MFQHPESFISFLLLLAVSGYCLRNQCPNKGIGDGKALVVEFPCITYFFISLYALSGSLIYCRDISSHTLWKWLYNMEIFIKTLSYPCFVTEIWLRYGAIQPGVAWIHAIVGAIPAVLFVLDNRLKKNWIDVIVFLSSLSLLIVCFQNTNMWGLCAAVTFTMGYYMERQRIYYVRIGPDLWFNSFVTAFCVCCLKSLNP